jgi:hypothetical protein
LTGRAGDGFIPEKPEHLHDGARTTTWFFEGRRYPKLDLRGFRQGCMKGTQQ